MNKDFADLISYDYDIEYLNHIQARINHDESRELSTIIQEEDLLQREKFLATHLDKTAGEGGIRNYANPFYIGFGNPNSKILFIGKEKAFNLSNRNLLIKESINNFAQWKRILSDNNFEQDQAQVVNKYGFSPLLPKAYHTKRTNKRHTWGIIETIIHNYSEHFATRTLNENIVLKDSIFHECFLTELNYIPSKYNEGSGLSDYRKSFLQNKFYRGFPLVVLGAKNYLGKEQDKILEELFGAERIGVLPLGTIGKKRPRELRAMKYKSNKQTIYVTNQLSGGSGWSNLALQKLAYDMKNESKLYSI